MLEQHSGPSGVGEGTQVRDGVTQLGVRVALLQAAVPLPYS